MKILRYRIGNEVKPGILDKDGIIRDASSLVVEWDNANITVDNYGNISDNPQLIDVNCGNAGSNGGPGGANGDWRHHNAIAYNAELDQIVMSSRHGDEIMIIDHSTTTEEAASHSGGNSM